jgi:hypothetical protein
MPGEVKNICLEMACHIFSSKLFNIHQIKNLLWNSLCIETKRMKIKTKYHNKSVVSPMNEFVMAVKDLRINY